jgi:hypothetical protein
MAKHGAIKRMRGKRVVIDSEPVEKPFCIVRLLCLDDMRLRFSKSAQGLSASIVKLVPRHSDYHSLEVMG